jgi:hypothetical protein
MPDHDDTDRSGSTAEFRAFVAQVPPDATQPWTMRAPRNRVAVLAATVLGVALVLVLIALLVIR